MEQNNYKRQRVGKYIIKVLQNLGGSASKQKIKEEIVADKDIDINYENVFIPIQSASGNNYVPFNFDFNFSLKELYILGYIEKYNRITDIILTEEGRKLNYSDFPNKVDLNRINNYWEKTHKDFIYNKKNKEIAYCLPTKENVENTEIEEEKQEDDLVDRETLTIKLIELIKKFSPKKFESFSRNLFSKMGIVFDKEKGILMSNDHGIDGYGIFESDDFRINKVVIQCKRFTEGSVGEPDIDKFRGVISKYSADYGIFITTSYFTENAKKAAYQFNPAITLIDGQRLVNLIIKYKLEINEIPVPYYNIFKYYYEEN